MKMRILILPRRPLLIFLSFILLSLFAGSALLINRSQDLTAGNLSNDSDEAVNAGKGKPKIAVIIDDFGEARDGVNEIMKIKKHLTFAVMPFLTYTTSDATEAHKRGYEVIVHMPMQSQTVDNINWLGRRPIMLKTSNDEIKKIAKESIDSVPHAVGVNIHMGSLASQNERVISNVMEVVKARNLYFVDSRTTPNTVCKAVAKRFGVKFLQRNIFLEHSSKTKGYIEGQLVEAGELALKEGYAVVIGHVGAEGGAITAQVLEEMIPKLESKGIEFVYASELLK
ncbi:protein of unknown function DUF610 YibQ [Syntrophobotulus glycolicus DSM 8271]|uniref:Divergent polysaccharide deacetylase n=1 Tax=Syntrophobotulus glycolicus (strain DSM 8271 / FlGlyR) TaxID=645991 RepID=F0SXL5_SYNGF|nr:divergent polysaccharide deacetylase family protein [Syntrophobotulus glycolicus]ADY55848.1 protein of unknown function DUF610 YibQ [Syntrophobotulus glycolicus DSM 8271]